MRNPKSILLILVLFSCRSVMAYSDGFGPYREGEEPPAFPYQIMEDVSPEHKGEEPIVNQFKSKDGFVIHCGQLEATTQDSEFEITLNGPDGKVLGHFSDSSFPFWGLTAIEGDFNQDKKSDFAVYLGNGGNGLAAERGTWVFFLSSEKGYSAVELGTDSIGINDLVQLGKDGCLRIIHTALIDAPEGVKVPPMTELYFRLYRLLKVSGSTIVEDKTSEPRFPKIVASPKWAEQQNHKETKLLTPKQKKEMIKNSKIF